MATKIFPFVCLFLLLTCSAGAAVLDANGNPDPTDARMSLWLKADEGVTHDANDVTEWENMSDNNFNAVAPSGSEPLLTTDTISGSVHDVVYFDDNCPNVVIPDAGTSDKLDPGTTDYTIFSVAKAAHGDIVMYSVKEDDTGSNGNGYRLYQCCYDANEGPTSNFRARFCSLPADSGSDDYNAGIELDKPQATFQSYRVLTIQMDVTGSTATIKGWLDGYSTGWTAGCAGADNDVIETFGSGGVDADGPWRMESSDVGAMWVAELLIYKGSITDAEREDIEGYLFAKYHLGFASNPSPADGAENVDPNVTLSWTLGVGALSHDVYFDTDFNDVNSATDPNTLPGRGNQEGTTYDPCGDLSWTQTYYWRIDEVYSGEVLTGDVWQFMIDDENSMFETSTVWPYFSNNQPNYRIPTIIVAPDNNDILAFAEKRNDGIGDTGNTDLVMKRSTGRASEQQK